MFSLLSHAIAEEAETVVEEVAAEPGWLESAFKKFAEAPGWTWPLIILLLVAGTAVLVYQHGKKIQWSTKMLSVGAICLALASVLSLIRLWRMPMGGSVTPASMLPILLFAYAYGAGPGCILGALYGVLQFILDGGEFAFAGLLPNLLDYPIGFAMLGLCGLFSKSEPDRLSLMTGIVVGAVGRILSSFLSGWIFYGQYAPEGWNPLVYSIAYNGAFIGVDCLICIVIASMVGLQLIRELKKAAR